MDEEVWRWIWLGVAAAGVIGEIALAGTFFLLPFGIGAALACVFAFAGLGAVWQWLAFIVATAGSTAALRPLARRMDRTALPSGVGASRWVGQTGTVLEAIPRGDNGIVRIGGEEWRASAEDDVSIPAGSRVLVARVSGTRLVVLPLELPEGGI